jgi:tetratricopeptide (TPR) repeat protein
MSRTGRRKIVYFTIVGGGAILGFWAIRHFALTLPEIILLVLVLLVPGRILGFFWRDLLRGLRLLKEKQYEESIRHSRAFLDQLQARPWIRHLIWLGYGTYSRDAQALALNNLGAAELMLSRLAEAKAHLESSIKVDGENPLPWFNVARWALSIGAGQEEVARYLAEARQRGLSQGISDKIMMASQGRFARTDGQGTRS